MERCSFGAGGYFVFFQISLGVPGHSRKASRSAGPASAVKSPVAKVEGHARSGDVRAHKSLGIPLAWAPRLAGTLPRRTGRRMPSDYLELLGCDGMYRLSSTTYV